MAVRKLENRAGVYWKHQSILSTSFRDILSNRIICFYKEQAIAICFLKFQNESSYIFRFLFPEHGSQRRLFWRDSFFLIESPFASSRQFMNIFYVFIQWLRCFSAFHLLLFCCFFNFFFLGSDLNYSQNWKSTVSGPDDMP